MSAAVLITLLLFGAIGSIAAGLAFALARARVVNEGEDDPRMRLVAQLLLLFGASCTYSAVGFAGVLAFGGVLAWFSYMLSAQQLEVFRISRWERRFATHVKQP
jgi:hypothetical protein